MDFEGRVEARGTPVGGVGEAFLNVDQEEDGSVVARAGHWIDECVLVELES